MIKRAQFLGSDEVREVKHRWTDSQAHAVHAEMLTCPGCGAPETAVCKEERQRWCCGSNIRIVKDGRRLFFRTWSCIQLAHFRKTASEAMS